MEFGFREGFEARKSHFGIDAHSREVMRQAWPIIAPAIDTALEEVLTAAAKLPHIAAIITDKRALIKQLEAAHFEAL